MLIGEAYAKISSEISKELAEKIGIEEKPLDELDLDDLKQLGEVAPRFAQFFYGGSAKDYIASRGQKKAQALIDEMSKQGVDFSDSAVLEPFLSNVEEMWLKDMVQVLAMGYSFASPEFAHIERDKEGFLQLCREVDRDLIAIQTVQFSNDVMLREKIGQQMIMAATLTSGAFAMTGRVFNKFTLRDFFFQIWASVAMNCFMIGHHVRFLMEEEAAFEAMMKEAD